MTSFQIAFERAIDKYVFSIPCYLFAPFVRKREIDKKKIKKILIIKLWAMGDSIVLLPTIQGLRKNFPDAKIDVFAHPRVRRAFEGLDFIDNIVDFGVKNILKMFKKYDVCIDAEPALNVSAVIASLSAKHVVGFSHGIRSKLYNQTSLFNKNQHMVQNYLDLGRKIGMKYDTDKLVPLYVPKEVQKLAKEFVKKKGIKENDFIVGMSPGVAESVKHRMWPLEKMAKLADIIIEKHNAKILFIDIPSNQSSIKKILSMMKHADKTIDASENIGPPIIKTELCKYCNVLIANDSGFMHTAPVYGIKTIGLFGPNTPKLWTPYGKGNISIVGHKKGTPYMDNTKPELIPKHLTKDQLTVMDAITVEEVLRAFEKIIKRK